jgi:lipopolysaccharide transport system ATP-binding protein
VAWYSPVSQNGKQIGGFYLSLANMADTVISVENVSKSYLVGHKIITQEPYTALRDVIAREAHNFCRKTMDIFRGQQVIHGDEIEQFWALKDISFEVKEAEVLGIIGSNGAGKSTLLKILSRITEPSRGRLKIRGRIASLLEVGTGFHPELTGRENIFLNGAIFGMPTSEIRKRFDEIVAFADVERFLDTPIKRYSSGMYVRLAFAVAAHLTPDILIVDEVLAVGDAEFQKKCLGKMDEVSRSKGRTVLLVSHNMGVITALCPSTIWMDKGSIRDRGDSRTLVGRYLAQRMQTQQHVLNLENSTRRFVADDRLRLKSLEWISEVPLRHGEPVRARICFDVRVPVADVAVGIGFSAVDGRRLLTYESDFQNGHRPFLNKPGIYSVDVEIDSLPLAPDIYGLDIGARCGDFMPLDYIPAQVWLDVVPGARTPTSIIRKDAGVRLESGWEWSTKQAAKDAVS